MKFYLSKQHNAVVINPAFVPGAATLPEYKPFEYRGERLFGIPHTLENTYALRQLGVKVPSPIVTQYDWPPVKGKYKPLPHQIEDADFLVRNERAFNLSEVGTMKTSIAVYASDYLIGEGWIRKVLIISPLSTLDSVWRDEIFQTVGGRRKVSVLHAAADKRKRLFAAEADYYVVNPDGLKILCDLEYDKKKRLVSAKLMRDDIDLIIIDELTAYRNSGTDRFAVLNTLLKGLGPGVRIWGMTGTPVPQDPSNAYGQIKIIKPERVPKFFTMFRQLVMKQVTQYKWEPREEATQIILDAMQPAIRRARDEIVQLPPAIYSERRVELTPEQERHYKAVLKDFVTVVESGQVINAVNQGVQQGKLLQIACGEVYDKEGQPVELDAKPRQELVHEIIEEAGQPVIVFVPYTLPLLALHKFLLKKGLRVGLVYGAVPKNERTQIFRQMQNNELDVLVADAGSMSHGITLTRASTIVWYGPELSNETYIQGNGRITRPGQVNVQNVIHIASTPLETKLYKRNEERGNTQNVLLELVRERGKAMLY